MLLVACLGVGQANSQADERHEAAVLFDQHVQPLLEAHCYQCHGDGASEGEIALDQLSEVPADGLVTDRPTWERIWTNLRWQLMPPHTEEQPADAERRVMLDWIERHALGIDPDRPDPGRVVIRRLNREEYCFTIEELLGVKFDTVEAFPPDDTGYGFDTVGAVLTVAPMLLEKYLEAAQQIVSEAIPTERPQRPAAGQEPGEQPGPEAAAYYRIFVDGPPPEENSARAEYSRKILRRLADRAFRRPVDEATLDQLVALASTAQEDHGKTYEEAIRHAAVAILCSPRFLYRAETLPAGDEREEIVALDDYALASRLSYFLWNCCPDETLLQIAAQQELADNLHEQVDRLLGDERVQRFVQNFVGQWLRTRDVEGKFIDVNHVLNSDKSELDQKIFSGKARRAMRAETEMLFAHILRENRSIDELLTAKYTFLNAGLATVYGIPDIEGDQMRRVDLPADSHRGGILSHGSVLMVTSNPRRTSPVNRGLFLLENVLGTPPPPAPPDVPSLAETKNKNDGSLTMRELMEQHRAAPLCRSCHARMDPLGLALENYSALGVWRDTDGGQTIDPSGQLVTGESFVDATELAIRIVEDRRSDFYRCVAEKLFVFAIGRGVEYNDVPTIDGIVRDLIADGGKARTLVHGIVDSVAFRYRRGRVHSPED